MLNFLAWVQQPTTIGGLAAFAGTASALLLQQMSWGHAIPILVGAATSMLLPDNTAAKNAAQTLAQDTVVLLGRGAR
jgi:hypothetical protein